MVLLSGEQKVEGLLIKVQDACAGYWMFTLETRAQGPWQRFELNYY